MARSPRMDPRQGVWPFSGHDGWIQDKCLVPCRDMPDLLKLKGNPRKSYLKYIKISKYIVILKQLASRLAPPFRSPLQQMFTEMSVVAPSNIFFPSIPHRLIRVNVASLVE